MSDEDIEKDIIKNINELKEKCKGIQPNLYEQVIGSCVNLFLNNKVCMSDEIKCVINDSEFRIYKWLINMEEYNYEEFDVSWLGVCLDKLLQTMATTPIVKTKIVNKVSETYISGGLNKRLLDQFFKLLQQ